MVTARSIMSVPVRTILLQATIADAARLLLRYGHSSLAVVNETGHWVGMMARRDVDLAVHHGLGQALVAAYMTQSVRTIGPDATLSEIEELMAMGGLSHLPVVIDEADGTRVVGIVTRADVLRQRSPACRDVAPSIARLAQPLQDLLTIAAQKAQERGWHLYLVGGGVRDLLLATGDEPVMLSDLDLVVDGYHQSAESGAGMILGEALQALYPAARLEIHGKFQTAALLWHQDPVLNSLWIDIATARTEFYPYPAANPEVEASSIQQDLYRRDFTINALALRLTDPNAGEMLDFFGGVEDLRSRRMRVLHANSFIEDPTRIYRGVRFAVRLGFEFDRQTESYIHHAIGSGIYQQVTEKQVAPALQTRLKAELRYILQTPNWRGAIQQLARLNALTCIHPMLQLTPKLWQELRLMEHWLKRFDPDDRLIHWQMRLEILIAAIPAEQRSVVAQNLQMTADSIDRLSKLAAAETAIGAQLPNCRLPSQVVELLQGYDRGLLLLVGVRLRSRRQRLRQYLSHWSQIKPLLNGKDLQTLGYKPGKVFKEILAVVLVATLDGEIGDKEGAIALVKSQYPM
jgi:tRNA nucleotidyltransferase (CCA-adding enzyme)